MCPDITAVNNPPEQPDEKTWAFIEELKTPLHQSIVWTRKNPAKNEVDLRKGVNLIEGFPDKSNFLRTAYDDFLSFLSIGGIMPGDAYSIVICRAETPVYEAYTIVVGNKHAEIRANDTEGIRRGLVYLEDEMFRAGGPFLRLGVTERRPVIRSRISRCFYGPINRPPKCRDELADDINYYPDEYLNRLAHDGINGLWLTITFEDTVPSLLIPGYGRDSPRRLAKLCRTVEHCARYGIKIYVFCIEPAAFPHASPVLKVHPELGGHNSDGILYFCPSTRLGQDYLEEATRTLFTEVPGLGGLIDISCGERATHCYSAVAVTNCPRCSQRKPWEVLSTVLSAMERGMHSVDKNAELVSWPYSQYIGWGEEFTRIAAGHVPENVILQHNFESGGQLKQLGKKRRMDDYWLSYAGPSDLYRDCAIRAVRSGRRMFAKLQVGCSHEVATVPHVPVPGILYQKYKRMHELGVSGAMQCWYFGNYPSLMTKAAGELSFAPFPKKEKDFLLHFARRDWSRHAAKVARAWQYFQRGYSQYPAAQIFGYYGPMHDGPVWPLYLEPKNLPLSPTWQICYPPSGDRIGEAIVTTHTLQEILILCRRMAQSWNKGVKILKSIAPFYRSRPEQMQDINVAIALGLQFQSGFNIIKFYALREKMFELRGRRRLRLLDQMRNIVQDELKMDRELLALTRKDSRLGFHSEAEGYKYFPAKITWRMNQLERLLANEFPVVEATILQNEPLFPGYTGEKPQGEVYYCRPINTPPAMDAEADGVTWEKIKNAECRSWHQFARNDAADIIEIPGGQWQVSWQAAYAPEALYFRVNCSPRGIESRKSELQMLFLCLEPTRLWPGYCFGLALGEKYYSDFCFRHTDDRWTSSSCAHDDGRFSSVYCIPWVCLGRKQFKLRPLRFNLVLQWYLPGIGWQKCDWITTVPAKPRLIYGLNNPSTGFGWIVFTR